MVVRITPNDKNNPPGKLADAEVHFTEGALEGMKLIGFAVWERRTGGGRNVTFPARQYSVNGERRTFALLRPANGDATKQDRIRAMVLQAWGHYGTVWPVVHHQLGVQPDMGRGRLTVVPQVPPGQPSVTGENIRLGDGSVDVTASHAGNVYRTAVRLHAGLSRFVIGHTVPRGSSVKSVRLDGRRAGYKKRLTNRGLEILVRARASGTHELVVTTR